MTKVILLVITLFATSNLQANDRRVEPLQTRAECNVNNIPDYFPFAQRVILAEQDTTIGDKEVKGRLKQMKDAVISPILEPLGSPIGVYLEQVAQKSEFVDAAYPQDGCRKSATLVHRASVVGETVRYGMVCRFDYNCIDNR